MKSKWLIALTLLLSASCASRDMGQMLADQQGSRQAIENMRVSPSTSDMHSSGGVDHSIIRELHAGEQASAAIPSFSRPKESPDVKDLGARSSTIQVLGAESPPQQYQIFDARELYQEIQGTHKRSFRFSYIYDTFTYQDDRGVYREIFRGSSKAGEHGFLLLSFDSYFYKMTHAEFFWLINAGVGGSYGRGLFIDQTESDASFTLWMLPLDLGLGLQVNLNHLVKLGVSGGPSVMGLIQNRSDVKDDTRQVSPGHFLEGRMSFNIGALFPRSSYRLYNNQNITAYYLTLFARSHDYQNFKQESFKMTGQSFGVGFTFEYL